MPAPVKGKGKGKGPALPKGAGKGPPLPKGASKGPKGPPPPGKGGKGKGGKGEDSGPRLRPFFWTAVYEAPQESIWWDLGEPAAFDPKLLERQFCIAPLRAKTEGGGELTPRSRAESERSKRLRVFDDRTSQLLAIAFNKLPPPEQLGQIVHSLEGIPDARPFLPPLLGQIVHSLEGDPDTRWAGGFPECLPSAAVLALAGALADQKEAVEQIKQMGEAELKQLDMPERYLFHLGKVPFIAQKLAIGKLIVGSALELGDLRKAGEKVGKCCQALRRSQLLKKVVSTTLAVGNILNRGTPRAGTTSLLLPDSLLKLDELRGNPGSEEEEQQGGNTLLDFVAQALLDQPGLEPQALLDQVGELLARIKDAETVSLEEVEAVCKKISAEAASARNGLADLEVAQPTKAVQRLSLKVKRSIEETMLAEKLTEAAKKELARTQLWTSAKKQIKTDEWLSGWRKVLEQLQRALGRAQTAAANRHRASLREANGQLSRNNSGVLTPRGGRSMRSNMSQLDDEARAEHPFKKPLPLGVNQFKMPLQGGPQDKENSAMGTRLYRADTL